MKNIAIIISLLTITSTVFAGNTTPNNNASTVLTTSVNNRNVEINWSSANNSRFEIERAFYSNNFVTIASVQNAFVNNINFRINDTDAELAGRKIAYYRVKQIAANGTITYSNITVVNLENAAAPSATKNSVINFTASENGNAVVKIQNITGKTVAEKNSIAAKGNNRIELENGLAKGIYTAVISVNGVVIDTQKIIAE